MSLSRTRKFVYASIAAAVLSPLVGGCSESVPSPDVGPPQTAVSSPQENGDVEPVGGTESQSRSSAVSLEVADEKVLAEAIQQQRGNVVLVDYWATWCFPCKELFPHTVGLYRKFSGQGLSVISVSLDDPESKSEALEFLKSKGAFFPNFISRYGAAPQSVEAFAITDGALPNLKLFDRSGKLHREFVAGRFKPDQLDDAVEELLKQPSP